MMFRPGFRATQTMLFDSRPTLVTNSFFGTSQLKSRIQMLITPPTNRSRVLWRYALVMPLLTVLIGLTAAREQIAKTLSIQPGESITVSGRVVGEDGRPVPKATVLIAGGRRGTSADGTGRFTLADVPVKTQLAISSVGFETQTVVVNDRNTITIALKRRQQLLGEIVVVGYESAPTSASAQDEVFTVIEQNPEFPGGLSELGQYLARNLRYPAEAQKHNVQGTVFLQFVVTSAGDISGLRIRKGIGSGCDEEAIRVVSQMPRWKPGLQAGTPVDAEFVLPIQFSLEKW